MWENPEVIIGLVNGVLDILARHKASGSTEPLTNEQVHAQLIAELKDGETSIAQEFAAKGWPLPS